MGGPVGAFASGVTGGFHSAGPANGGASGTLRSGDATALFGGGGCAASRGLPSISGLDSIENTIEHINPATFEMVSKLFA